MDANIRVNHLSVRYRDFVAVNDISFEVCKGEIFAIIGPNGSGKTSTVECVEGLRKPSSGEISVLGMDPQKRRREINRKVGVQLQSTEYQSRVKVGELCSLFQSFYTAPADVDPLLKEFGLLSKRKSYVSALSGGERQKLSVVLSLLPNPEILFLDELTTGLDPEARSNLWDLIQNINDGGTTILMVSHFMDEVEYLANRVMLLKDGKILTSGTVGELRKNLNVSHKASFRMRDNDSSQLDEMRSLPCISRLVTRNRDVTAYGNGESMKETILKYLNEHGLQYRDFHFQEISFEDVYLFYTGYESGRSDVDEK